MKVPLGICDMLRLILSLALGGGEVSGALCVLELSGGRCSWLGVVV